ncbi:MAG: tetratricopeptide repeat protein [Candidatus Obscuribacterales bacterium]|nr:tetratricopeptide repeat protein [Candidatus Obscuribacterales bacterium]
MTEVLKFGTPLLLSALIAISSLSGSLANSEAPNEADLIQAELNMTRDLDRALKKLQDLIQREPNNLEAHMTLGKVLAHMGYESLADEQFRIVDKLDPNHPNSILSIFRHRLETQGAPAANEYLLYVQRRFPKDPSVMLMEGMIERMRGNEIKAEFYYSTAMERHPDYQGIATTFAILRMSQKRFQDAIKLAERDIALSKEHPVANLAKGQSLLLLGNYKDAIPCLEIALKNAVDKRGVADSLSRAYIYNQQFGESLKPTISCLAETPLSEQQTVNQLKKRISFILTKVSADELLNTLKIAEREIRFQQTMAGVYFACADVLDKTGHPSQSAIAFAEGIKLYPYNGRPFMRLGMIKERAGNYTGAYKDYTRAYQLNPEDREIAARLRRMILQSSLKYDLAGQIKCILRRLTHQNMVQPDLNY